MLQMTVYITRGQHPVTASRVFILVVWVESFVCISVC